jgi:hypothetical protein
MKIEFGGENYIQLTVAEKGTVGIPYECMLSIKAQSDSFSGHSSTWVDGIDMQTFIEELKNLDKNLQGKATLSSESPGELDIEIKPVDTLGHFVFQLMIGKTTFIQSEVCEEKVMIAFPFESQSVSMVCGSLANYLENVLNA